MARQTLEQQLAALNDLRRQAWSDASTAALRKTLGSASSHVVAKAAAIAGEFEVAEVTPQLVEAFERFMQGGGGNDKGCSAKAAIADTLYRVGYDRPGVFLHGIRHVQVEPVYGGRVDTAVELRASCALGLVRMNYPEAMNELVVLLADKEPVARVGAARAMAYRGGDDAAAVLRLKVLLGDADERVPQEAMLALLQVDAKASQPFVVERLRSEDATLAEAAALALGQSRLAEAFEPLRDFYESTLDADLRKATLTAMALLRHEAATAFLLDLITNGSSRAANDALRALAAYRYDPTVARRVTEAVEKREDPALRRVFDEAFNA